MKVQEVQFMRRPVRQSVCIGLVLAMGFAAAGCGSLRWPGSGKSNRSSGDLEIVPRNNRYSLTVTPSADDIVTMMLKVGFSEQQIVDLGEKLRNTLASSGAAEVRRGKEVGAIFAVYTNDTIFITTRRGGSYIYDTRSGRFRLGDEAQSPAPTTPGGEGGTPPKE
jgi:hypothetical protein